MGNLIVFEFKKFFSRKKNILTIFISAIFILIYIIAHNSLNGIVEKSRIDNYQSRLKSAREALSGLNKDKDSGGAPQTELEMIDQLKREIALLQDMLRARSNNDWKGELTAQISLDKQLLADVESGSAVSGEKAGDIENRVAVNESLLEKNIKTMTAYNFIRLSMQQLFPVLSIIVTLLLSADFVSSESDEGTFKFLLIQPVSRNRILLSKIIASASICVSIMLAGAADIFSSRLKLFKSFSFFGAVYICRRGRRAERQHDRPAGRQEYNRPYRNRCFSRICGRLLFSVVFYLQQKGYKVLKNLPKPVLRSAQGALIG